MLNGVLTSEDEEMVEKELTELISDQTVAPELPSIPDEEPVEPVAGSLDTSKLNLYSCACI